jgi:hypothetical protein
MSAGKKARDQAHLLPGFPLFAPDGLGTNKKGHLGLSIPDVTSRRTFASSEAQSNLRRKK